MGLPPFFVSFLTVSPLIKLLSFLAHGQTALIFFWLASCVGQSSALSCVLLPLLS